MIVSLAIATEFSTILPGREIDEYETDYLESIHGDLIQFHKWRLQLVGQMEKLILQHKPSRKQKKTFEDSRQILAGENPTAHPVEQAIENMLDVWANVERLVDYTISKNGKSYFGDQSSLVNEFGLQLIERIEQVAAKNLPAETYLEMKEQIEEYSRDYPLEGDFGSDTWLSSINQGIFSTAGRGQKMLTSLVSVPLAPMNATRALNQGSQSISDISVTAERFTTVIENLPVEIRRQLQEFLSTLSLHEDRLTVLLEQADRVSQNISTGLEHADRVTSGVQRTIKASSHLVKQAEPSLQILNQTVQKAHELVLSVERLQAQLKVDSGGAKEPFNILDYEKTARAVEIGAANVNTVLTEINQMIDEARENKSVAQSNTKSFNILDYERTSQSIGQAAIELRALLNDLDSVTAEKDPDSKQTPMEQRAARMTGRVIQDIEDLVDYVTIRLIFMIGLIFCLTLLYHWIPKRNRRRNL
jgi:hypothetical protein